MQMEPQLSLDCGACLRSNNIFHKDGTSGVNVTSHAQDNVSPRQPAKKQTRHWAAWTRQEEESFFTALRQFGKNFEKITSRVQSKNKDQVRHYYYRLVRRMNKLLGPELCLDAKNSKDTNAAMLRCWSLLEKYSCKASKLHLKPRRFKIFLDTLEHQLLKDRRKNVRKKSAQGEICSTTASATVSSQGKASLNDSRSVKIVLLDSQNIQTSGSGKGSSLKRNTNIGVNRSNCKGDSFSLKTARLRRKGTKAAYKRWEKAAIAGVSLVADAAVHLEWTGLDEVVELVKETRGEMGVAPGGKVVPSLPTLQNLLSENNVQNSTKLKLQLFPIDETTRRALEMDNHNPHLELTLSTRKKISSVLEHLNRKWGKSSIACGELGLLPYCIQRENLVNCQRWTQDSSLSAADVYAQIGSPSLFRLRYCWFSNADHEAATCQAPLASPSILDKHKTNMNTEHQNVDLLPYFTPPSEPMSDKLNDHCKDQVVLGIITELVPASTDVHTDMIECISTGPDKDILDSFDNPPVIYLPRETCNVPITGQVEEKAKNQQKVHAIMIPYPFQGHVIPIVHLAIKLASRGFTITFVNTHSIHQQISKAQSSDPGDIFAGARESGLDIRYASVSDGLPLEFDRSLNHDQYQESLLQVSSVHVDELVGKLVCSSNPPASCLIADTFFVWPSSIASKYNLVNVSFWTEPALVFTLYYHLDLLRQNGHFASSDNRLNTIRYIPGVQAIEPRDLMSYLQASDITTVVHRIIYKAFKDAKRADFVICNTVQELEHETLSALNRKQPIYAIGPIFPIDFAKTKIATSLWSESDCSQWLNTKANGSVLYVSFGSHAHVSKHDIVEIAHGLSLSPVDFVWVLRPDIVSSDDTDILPAGFEDDVKDRGLIVPWCHQNRCNFTSGDRRVFNSLRMEFNNGKHVVWRSVDLFSFADGSIH